MIAPPPRLLQRAILRTSTLQYLDDAEKSIFGVLTGQKKREVRSIGEVLDETAELLKQWLKAARWRGFQPDSIASTVYSTACRKRPDDPRGTTGYGQDITRPINRK